MFGRFFAYLVLAVLPAATGAESFRPANVEVFFSPRGRAPRQEIHQSLRRRRERIDCRAKGEPLTALRTGLNSMSGYNRGGA